MRPDDALLGAARKTADALVPRVRHDGYLAGRFYADWRPAAPWACLTGSVQIAWCWLQLFDWTGEPRYRDAALRANAFVRRTIATSEHPDRIGGVRGSFPISGWYGRFQYLNWAAKFAIDSFRRELALK